MSRKYKFHNPRGISFVSVAVIHYLASLKLWQAGIDVFTRRIHNGKKTIVIEKTRVLLLLIITLISFQYNSFSQTKKWAAYHNDLLSRILIVQVEEENSLVIEKLNKEKKSDLIAQYRKDIEQYNMNIKEVTGKYWQVNDSIVYKTFKEIMEIPYSQKEKFHVLRCVSKERTIRRSYSSGTSTPGTFEKKPGTFSTLIEFVSQDYIDWDTKTPDNDKGKKREYPYYLTMEYFPLDKFEEGAKTDEEDVHAVTNIFTSKCNLVCVMLRIRHEFDFALNPPTRTEYRGNAHTDSLYLSLKNKVLLISQSDLDPELNERKIRAIYHYSVAVVSNEEFESAVLTCNSDMVLFHNYRLIYDIASKKEAIGIINPYIYSYPGGYKDDYPLFDATTFETLKNCAEGKYIKK